MNEKILGYIREIRKQKKLNQQEMGELLGMKTSSYGDIENGITKMKLDDFLLICKKLEIDPLVLVKNTEQIIITIDNEQAELINDLNNQIQKQIKFNNMNIQNNTFNGDVVIGTQIKK